MLLAGDVAWVVVLGSIALYELWATVTRHQTMSESIWRAVSGSWIGKLIVVVLLGVLAVHLTTHARRTAPTPPGDPCEDTRLVVHPGLGADAPSRSLELEK